MSQLDRETVENAFRTMGEYLRDRKILGEIVVYGGSAIMLQFDWRSSTHDVDARITSDSVHGHVQTAVHYAATKLGLQQSWLNEAVASYVSKSQTSTDTISYGMYPDYFRPGLRVLLATPRYLLAMKLMAISRHDRDFNDAANLAMEVGVQTYDDMMELVGGFYPEDDLPEMVRLRFHDLEEVIANKKAFSP